MGIEATGAPRGGAIDFTRTFGQNNQQSASTGSARGDQPKAQFWLNIGYDSGVVDEATGESRFIALPVGIPLDTQEHVNANARHDGYAAAQAARNDLLDQMMAVAQTMDPGESRILKLDIQLRRISADREPVKSDQNPFVKKLDL